MRAVIRSNRRKGTWQRYRGILLTCLITVAIDASLACMAHFSMGSVTGGIYMQMVFLPLAAFVSAFFTLLVTRSTGLCIILPLVIHLLTYWLTLGFSFSMFLWALLYLVSGFIGLAISYIVMTHKGR